MLCRARQKRLAPARVTGASGGAVVAAMYAAGHTPASMLPLFAELKFGDIFEFRPRLYWGFPYACPRASSPAASPRLPPSPHLVPALTRAPRTRIPFPRTPAPLPPT